MIERRQLSSHLRLIYLFFHLSLVGRELRVLRSDGWNVLQPSLCLVFGSVDFFNILRIATGSLFHLLFLLQFDLKFVTIFMVLALDICKKVGSITNSWSPSCSVASTTTNLFLLILVHCIWKIIIVVLLKRGRTSITLTSEPLFFLVKNVCVFLLVDLDVLETHGLSREFDFLQLLFSLIFFLFDYFVFEISLHAHVKPCLLFDWLCSGFQALCDRVLLFALRLRRLPNVGLSRHCKFGDWRVSFERLRVSRESTISSSTHLFGLLLHVGQSQLFFLLSILYSLLDFIPFADFVLLFELCSEG